MSLRRHHNKNWRLSTLTVVKALGTQLFYQDDVILAGSEILKMEEDHLNIIIVQLC